MNAFATVCNFLSPIAETYLPLLRIFGIIFAPAVSPRKHRSLLHRYLELSVSSPKNLTNGTVRVLVADQSRIHTRLLAEALERDPQLEVMGFEGDCSGLASAAASQAVDVVVLSATLDEQPSRAFEILHEIRNARQKTRSVILLGSSKDEFILSAFRAGARGLFSKDDPLELLGECVQAVHEGKIWASNHALVVAIEALANSPVVRTANSSGMSLLSKRELQVVAALAEGLTNREIAQQLNLSPHTIKNYLFRIFDKLGVSSRIELLFMALSQPAAEAPVHWNEDPAVSSVDAAFLPVEFAVLEKSAEAGMPAAQFALSQLHFARGRDPKDLIEAYTWYLVATERALLARGQITKLLTPEQIEEAKHKASVRLSRLNRSSSGLRGAVSSQAN